MNGTTLAQRSLALLGLACLASFAWTHEAEAQTATLRGFLIDSATGGPVVQASVQIEGLDVAATSDGAGQFQVGPIPPGSYRMTIAKSGYHARSFTFTITPEHPSEIDIGGMLLIPVVLYSIEVDGRVTNVNTGEVIKGAVVTLDGRLQMQTDDDGAFHFATDDFEPGTSQLSVRMVGYEPTSYPFRVTRDSARLDVELPLLPLPVQLDEIIVEGRQITVPSRMRGFFDRRDRGQGEYLTPWEIETTPHTRVTDLMRRVPGVIVTPGPMGRNELTLTRGCRETPNVFIDGLYVPNADIDNILRAGDVYAVEVYVGSARVPPEFQRNRGGCGVVVFWTK